MIRYSVVFVTTASVGNPVRLYMMVYDTITPLGTIGGDHVNKMEDESMTTGEKSTGGLPGTGENIEIVIACIVLRWTYILLT